MLAGLESIQMSGVHDMAERLGDFADVSSFAIPARIRWSALFSESFVVWWVFSVADSKSMNGR